MRLFILSQILEPSNVKPTRVIWVYVVKHRNRGYPVSSRLLKIGASFNFYLMWFLSCIPLIYLIIYPFHKYLLNTSYVSCPAACTVNKTISSLWGTNILCGLQTSRELKCTVISIPIGVREHMERDSSPDLGDQGAFLWGSAILWQHYGSSTPLIAVS